MPDVFERLPFVGIRKSILSRSYLRICQQMTVVCLGRRIRTTVTYAEDSQMSSIICAAVIGVCLQETIRIFVHRIVCNFSFAVSP